MHLGDAFFDWRKERSCIANLEGRAIFDHDWPLSDSFEDWRRFKAKVRPEDEIWTFCSPREEWDRHRGWQGVLLRRDGEVIDFCITAQN